MGGEDRFRAADGGLPLEAPDRHFHVRLAGGEPDFADEDVLQGDFLAVADGDLVRAAGRRGSDADQPLSGLRIGRRPDGLLVPGGLDRYFPAGLRLSPEGGVGLLLEDHVVSDDGRQRNLGLEGAAGEQGRQRDEKEIPFHCNAVSVFFRKIRKNRRNSIKK